MREKSLTDRLTVQIYSNNSTSTMDRFSGVAYLPDGREVYVANGAAYLGQEREIAFSDFCLTDVFELLSARVTNDGEYGIYSLIQGEIAVKRSYVHEDFSIYYLELLKLLKSLLLEKSISVFDETLLNMLFQSTIDSYLSIKSPLGHLLEAGLLHKKIEKFGDGGAKIDGLLEQIRVICEQNREIHLQILVTLYQEIYGVVDNVITSQDLMAAGFDDSAEPHALDYVDFF